MKKRNTHQNSLLKLLFLLSFSFSFAQGPRIIFGYDAAGNQTTRKFCLSGDCSSGGGINMKEDSKEEETFTSIDKGRFDDMFTLYPNPTQGIIKLTWEEEVADKIQKIELVGMSNPYFKNIVLNYDYKAVETNVTNEFTGMYIFKVYLDDGSVLFKKFIKE